MSPAYRNKVGLPEATIPLTSHNWPVEPVDYRCPTRQDTKSIISIDFNKGSAIEAGWVTQRKFSQTFCPPASTVLVSKSVECIMTGVCMTVHIISG